MENKIKLGQELIVTTKTQYRGGVRICTKAKVVEIGDIYFKLEGFTFKNLEFNIETLENQKFKCYSNSQVLQDEIDKKHVLKHLQYLLPGLSLKELKSIHSKILQSAL
jgi:hypothetical protein